MHRVITSAILAAAAFAAATATPAQTPPAIGIESFQLGQSAAMIEKARNDRMSANRATIEQARAGGSLTGAIDPHLGTGITQTNTAGGYDFMVGDVRVLATCKAKGMRIYAILQKRSFRNVTVADVMPALKQKYGANGRTVHIQQRPGMTNTEQWVLWGPVPAGIDGDMVQQWGRTDQANDALMTLPAGMAAYVTDTLHSVDVKLSRYSPEIAADALRCGSDARGAAHQNAVGAIRF